MRPRLRTLAPAALVLLQVLAPPVAAQDLPPGFTDGRPVGEEEGTPETARASQVSAAAATQRYFGEEAYAAIRTSVSATSRSCPITDDGLTALVLSPVFKESSAATTAATAPAPMTLSRYDEWTGTYSTSSNADANYGLYAFRNPYTAYSKAYWHPGIGIWQYDSAGLGAPFTAVERMDVGIMATDVAATMAARYCTPSSGLIGHGPPYSDQERRYSAWAPWGYPCTLCQGFFEEMMGVTPRFANLHLVAGITPLGGTVRRTCTLAGVSGTLPCWYVDPSVDVIEGATAWATLRPDGGGDPTAPPAPLSAPFYVLDRGTTEERHWLHEDTGYAIDIRAGRTIGKNARPRSSQPGSGLEWSTSSDLCDLGTRHGACTDDPIPPQGMTSAAVSASSGFRPVALDADGDGRGDVLWYRPGPGSDHLWRGTGGGTFSSSGLSVSGSYDDVVAGDVDGDGDDDVLWYERATGASYLWRSNGNGSFTSLPLAPGPGRRPFLLDADGGADLEVFWYGPGSVGDSLWSWSGSGFASSSRTVSGTYEPIVGDLDANGRDDIVWYGPGATADHLWLHSVHGGWVSKPLTVNGTYQPLVGDLDGDGGDDLFWYAEGPAADSIWFGAPQAAFDVVGASVSGTYVPVVSVLGAGGRDSIVWYGPGGAPDHLWSWSGSRSITSSALSMPGRHQGVVGRFSTGGADGVLWYGDATTDSIWYR